MKISEVSLDATDLQILRLLQDEGRLSNARLAERLKLSETPRLAPPAPPGRGRLYYRLPGFAQPQEVGDRPGRVRARRVCQPWRRATLAV